MQIPSESHFIVNYVFYVITDCFKIVFERYQFPHYCRDVQILTKLFYHVTHVTCHNQPYGKLPLIL